MIRQVVSTGENLNMRRLINLNPRFEKLYSIQEYAEFLRVSSRTVYRMIKSKEIIAFKVKGQWRIHEKDFDRLMSENLNIKE